LNLLFEIQPPTVYSLFGIIFDFEEINAKSFRASKPDILLSIFNTALIKLNTEEDFFLSNLISQVQSIYGNLKSYNCHRKKKNRSKVLLPKVRYRRYLINNNPLPYNYKLHLKRIRHFFNVTKERFKLQRYKYLLHHIEEFYDLYDDLDDSYDYYSDDDLDLISDLFHYNLLSLLYQTLYSNLYKNKYVIKSKIVFQSLYKLLRDFENSNLTYNDLISPNIFLYHRYYIYLWKLNLLTQRNFSSLYVSLDDISPTDLEEETSSLKDPLIIKLIYDDFELGLPSNTDFKP
jgi:hypothetical protein